MGTCTWYAGDRTATCREQELHGWRPGNSTTYWYRVRDVANSTFSAYSNVAQATTGSTTQVTPTAPNAPTGLTAAAASDTQINLTWADNSGDESGFLVERCTATCTAYVQIAQLGANVSSYSNTGLTASTAYTYRVRAYSGTLYSTYSNTAQGTTSAPAPHHPERAHRPNGGRSLGYANQPDVGRQLQQRERLPRGALHGNLHGLCPDRAAGANVSSYSNTGLTASTAYTYRVRAYTGTLYSTYSNTAQATTTAATTGSVVIPAGSSIQAAVNSNPEGTSFLIKAGVYRLQTVVPKAGDIFTGEAGAILNGSRQVSPVQSGSYWVVTGQSQQGVPVGMCEPTNPGCMYPEDLFFDNVPLVHVLSLGAVGPGKWYFDYGGDTVYMADNPAGHVVEIGVQRTAFTGSVANVQIRNLVIEKYANPGQIGAIGEQYPGPGWVLDGNEVRLNHGVGIRAAANMTITNNKVHHNGELGIGGIGNDILVQGNEIAYNNNLNFFTAWGGRRNVPFRDEPPGTPQ